MKKRIGIVATVIALTLLITACGEKEDSIIKTGSELPENGKTAIVSAEGSVFAANYFAQAPSGNEDSSKRLQELIDKASEKGGTVYLKGGVYRLSEPLVLHDNVSLRGDYSAPNSNNNAQTETVLVVLPTESNKSNPIIKTGNGSTVSGIKIWFDGRNYSDTEEFGYAISVSRCDGVTVENVTIPNSNRGIELSAATNATLRQISVTAFAEGVHIDSASGFVSLSDISVSPVYLLNDARYTSDTIAATDVTEKLTANATGIYIGNAEEVSVYNSTVDTAKNGITVNMPETGEGLLTLAKCSTVNCQTSVYTEEASKNGFTVESSNFASNGLSGSVGLHFSKNYKSQATVSNCNFTGFPDVAVKSEGSGLTSLTNCNFIGWHQRAFESSDETLSVLFSYFGLSKSLGILENYGVGMFIDCTFQAETLIEGGNYIQNDEKSGYTVAKPDLTGVYTSDPYTLKNKKYVTAADFGLSENLEDAGPSIQQAIGSANENGAAAVLIDAGTYTVKTPITLPDGIYIIGAGSNGSSRFSTKLNFDGDKSLLTVGKNSGVSGIIISGSSPAFAITATDVSEVKITDVAFENVQNGINFTNVKNARISDVTGAALSEGIRLEKCENVFTGFNRLEAAGKNGISVIGGKTVLLQNSVSGYENGLSVSSDASTVSVGDRLVKNRVSVNILNAKNALSVATLSAPENGYHFAVYNGKASFYGTVTGGSPLSSAIVKGGECGIYSGLFKKAGDTAIQVSAGSAFVCGNVFPEIPTNAHFSQTGGKASAVGNIVRSNTVFAALNSRYMKTDVSGGSFEEKFSIKGYDANEGDNDEESDSE